MATEPRKTVVITQPMYFPWVGIFEQIALADVLVIYDDVQFTQGGFINRVQTKTAAGTPWLTVPITASLHTPINKVRTAENRRWRARHRKTLAQSYARAPYVKDMLALVDRGHPEGSSQLVDVLVDGMQAVIDYFGIQVECVRSSTLGVGGSGSQRVLDIVSLLDGGVYVTGHGAREYLDHELFERSGVQVDYLDYAKTPYPQLHGPFTPFVSVLDLVANCGRGGRSFIRPATIGWREFCARVRSS